jgi:ATP-dependent Clp protease ATP-binding subunit ClpB
MDFNKLTLKSQEAVAGAQELARRDGNPEVYPEHLLLALLDQELPRALAGDPQELRQKAESELKQRPSVSGAGVQPHASILFSSLLDRA